MAAQPFVMTGSAPSRTPKAIPIENDKGRVPPPFDYQHINADKEEAVWISLNGKPFTVQFENGSPFNDYIFPVPAGGTVHSGPVVRGNDGDEFKYSVTYGGNMSDPKIIIDR